MNWEEDMKRNSLSAVATFGVAMLAVFGHGSLLQSDEANSRPAVDPRIEELHIRLCGTKA